MQTLANLNGLSLKPNDVGVRGAPYISELYYLLQARIGLSKVL